MTLTITLDDDVYNRIMELKDVIISARNERPLTLEDKVVFAIMYGEPQEEENMEEIKMDKALRAKEILKTYCKQFNECEDGCVFVKHDYDPCSDSSRCSLCCPPYAYGDPWRRLHDMRKDDELAGALDGINTKINAAKGVLANHKECLSELDSRLVKCEGKFDIIMSIKNKIERIEAYHEHRMAGIEKKLNKIYEEYEEFLKLEDEDDEVNPRSLV